MAKQKIQINENSGIAFRQGLIQGSDNLTRTLCLSLSLVFAGFIHRQIYSTAFSSFRLAS